MQPVNPSTLPTFSMVTLFVRFLLVITWLLENKLIIRRCEGSCFEISAWAKYKEAATFRYQGGMAGKREWHCFLIELLCTSSLMQSWTPKIIPKNRSVPFCHLVFTESCFSLYGRMRWGMMMINSHQNIMIQSSLWVKANVLTASENRVRVPGLFRCTLLFDAASVMR